VQSKRNKALHSAIAGGIVSGRATMNKVEICAKQIFRGQIHLCRAAGRIEHDRRGVDPFQRRQLRSKVESSKFLGKTDDFCDVGSESTKDSRVFRRERTAIIAAKERKALIAALDRKIRKRKPLAPLGTSRFLEIGQRSAFFLCREVMLQSGCPSRSYE
jgi:hypothetical protein